MQIELTDDERDVLYAILYCAVGGDPKGPRQHADSLLDKIQDKSQWDKYEARIEYVTRFNTSAVVVKERSTWKLKSNTAT